MKTKRLITIIFSLFITVCFTACAESPVKSQNESKPDVAPAPTTPPAFLNGFSDTVLYPTEKTPLEIDDLSALFTVLGKLQSTEFYTANSSGESVAKKGFIEYAQKTSGSYVKLKDKHYMRSASSSAFVNVKNEALEYEDCVYFKRDGSKVKKTSKKEYAKTVGVTPSKLLSAHIYNENTVSSVTKTVNGDDTFTYEIKLKKDEAHEFLKYQMKNFGGLKDYPVFLEDTAVTLTINGDYLPIKFVYKSKYTVSVSVLGSLTCNETNATVFGYQKSEIPNEAYFIKE